MDTRNFENCHPFPREISRRLHVLGNDAFPLYLIRGERGSALIEAGVSATAGEAMDQLGALGVEPDFVVITHPHVDHLTGLERIRRRFPAIRVVAGEGAAAFLSHPRAAEAIVAEDRRLGAALRTRGYPAPSEPASQVPQLVDGMTRSDGEEIDLGGVTLRFLAVRGHAPANLAVFIPALEALLVSDSLGFHYPAGRFFPLFFTGYAEYMTTMDRLASLKPAILCLGHHGVMQGAETDAAFVLARRCASLLRERLRSGPGEEEAAAEIFAEFYRDELTLYSRENIMHCCRLLVRRSREEVEAC